MTELVPYVGKLRSGRPYRPRTERPKFKHSGPPRPMDEILGTYSQERALHLFHAGYDTTSIAWLLQCTEAAAANGLARARDMGRER